MVGGKDVLQEAGDRRLTTVAILFALSVLMNIAFAVAWKNRTQEIRLLSDDNNLTAQLSSAQIKLLGQQVVALESAIAGQTERIARVEQVAERRHDHITALQTVAERRERAHQAAMREREMRARELVLRASARIGARLAESARRNIAAMFGEAVPGWGIPVIVGTTSLEIKDACENLQDIHDLNTAFLPDATGDENRDYVCGLKVPTVDELKAHIRNAIASTGKTLQDYLPEWMGGPASEG